MHRLENESIDSNDSPITELIDPPTTELVDVPNDPVPQRNESETSAEAANENANHLIETAETEMLHLAEKYKLKRDSLLKFEATFLVFLGTLVLTQTFSFLWTLDITEKGLILVNICKNSLMFWIIFKGVKVTKEVLPSLSAVRISFIKYKSGPTIYTLAGLLRIAIFQKRNKHSDSLNQFLGIEALFFLLLLSIWGIGFLFFKGYFDIYAKHSEDFEKLKQENPGVFIF